MPQPYRVCKVYNRQTFADLRQLRIGSGGGDDRRVKQFYIAANVSGFVARWINRDKDDVELVAIRSQLLAP